MKRWRLMLLSLAVLLLIVASFGAWVLHTEAGLRFAAARAQSMVAGLTIGRASGSLGSTAQFERIAFEHPSMRFQASRIRAEINLLPLLLGRINLAVLDLDRPQLTLTKVPATDSANMRKAPVVRSLPTLHIDRLSATQVRIDRDGEAPMLWASLVTALDLHDTHVVLHRARLVHADYQIDGDLGIDLNDRWFIEHADLALLADKATGHPLQARLTRRIGAAIDVQIAQPLRAALQIQPEKAAGDFRGKLSLPEQDGAYLGLSTDLPLLAEMEFSKTARALSIGGAVGLGPHRVTVADAEMQWLDSGLNIESLSIAIADMGSVRMKGLLPISDASPLALELSTTGLRFEPINQKALQLTGTLKASGRYTDLKLEPDFTLVQKGLPPGAVTGNISLNAQAITFDALLLRLPRGSLGINGAFARGGDATAELALTLDAFDPSMFFSDWPGALSGAAQWNGGWGDRGLRGALAIAHVDGTLRQQSFDLQGSLQFDANQLHDTVIEARLGDARLQLNGDFSGPSPLTVVFTAADLSTLHDAAKGRLQLNAVRDNAWHVDTEGANLQWDEISLAALSLHGSIGSNANPKVDLEAQLSQLASGDLRIAEINLALLGSRDEHSLKASIGSDQGQLQLTANGSWSKARWMGVIEQLDLQLSDARRLRLQQPATLEIGSRLVTLGAACWNGSDEAQLCLQGEYEGGNGRFTLDVGALPLNWLSSLTEDTGYAMQDAVLNGNASATWADGTLRNANIHLASDEGRLLLRDRADLLLGYRALQIDATFDGSTGIATGSTELLPEGQVDAHFDLARDASGAFGYDGNVSVLIHQLDAIEAFTTEIANPTGQINGQFRLQKDSAGFHAGGALALSNFKAEVPSLGLSLKNGSMALAGVPEGLILRGAVQSGDGTLTVDGRWNDDRASGVALTIKGENVRLANIPELSLVATPDLKLSRDQGGWALSGIIDIPKARIQADQINSNARQSADVVVIDDPQNLSPKEKWRAHVDVRMGEDVQLKGFGFDGKLRGQLAVRQSNARSATATGQLGVTGLYNAYGQKLTVARGELLYAGSRLDEPTVSVRAERKIGDSTAGIEITGTARQLISRVYSRPVLSESEALALLVTGRRLRDVRGGDANRLSGAALALGTIGGDMLAKNLGLDELGVSSNSGLQGEAFTIGKYLSPRLYVGYGIGLLTRGEVFTVRYLINDRIDVEANIGERQRAAVNYRIER